MDIPQLLQAAETRRRSAGPHDHIAVQRVDQNSLEPVNILTTTIQSNHNETHQHTSIALGEVYGNRVEVAVVLESVGNGYRNG